MRHLTSKKRLRSRILSAILPTRNPVGHDGAPAGVGRLGAGDDETTNEPFWAARRSLEWLHRSRESTVLFRALPRCAGIDLRHTDASKDEQTEGRFSAARWIQFSISTTRLYLDLLPPYKPLFCCIYGYMC